MKKYYDIALWSNDETGERVQVTEYTSEEMINLEYYEDEAKDSGITAEELWLYENVTIEWSQRFVPNIILGEEELEELKKKLEV